MNVVVRPRAASGIEATAAWFETTQPGMGSDFVVAVEAALTRVGAHPFLYAVIVGHVRRIPLWRFHYGLFYEVVGQTVFVLACEDLRRDPARVRDLLISG